MSLPIIGISGLLRAVGLAAVAAGLVCVSEAAWIHVKASLAQILIGAAWRREQAGSAGAAPWAWADTRPIARLTIGAGSGARMFTVLEGASGRNLAFGPAHDSASVLPGERGNSVIEGHRDTHFAVLRNVSVGDMLHVETPRSRDMRFVVRKVGVVDSRRARILLQADLPTLTLVTCYPFDAVAPGGPLRWVVSADAVR